MRRIVLATALMITLGSNLAQAQNFGKFLEKAARDTLRDELSPKIRERPGQPTAQPTQTPQPEAQPYPVRTADGWTLVAHRYKPTKPKPGTPPVILCHGLTYNALFWDLEPSISFAQYLQAMGYDVWSVSLRGSGMSSKWVGGIDDAPSAVIGEVVPKLSKGKMDPTGYASIDPKFADYTMDSHIHNDVLAFVNLVKKETGSPSVAWVGHSLGGIVAIAHLARFPNPGIGKLIAIGSQVTMPNGQVVVGFFDEMIRLRQAEMLGLMSREQMLDVTRTTTQNLFYNVQNIQPSIAEALSTWAADVPGIGLMKQYMALANQGELLDAAGKYSYARNLKNITIPVLFGCGAADRFAPPVCQKSLIDNVASADKTLIIFGRASGLSVDCGHDDALVGLNSRAEVWPTLEKWLATPR